MFEIVLMQPQIAPNTGNIIRLCANTGTRLHLIGPLGFELDDKRLRRAGLDYREWAEVREYPNWPAFRHQHPGRVWAISKYGQQHYQQVSFAANDAFLFGSETQGLGAQMLSEFAAERILRIPMLPNSRSLNLSNAVAVVVYEAWRQLEFTQSV